MLRRFVIRARIDYECSTSIAKFTPVTTIFFLLNKMCDGGSSREPFLKAATLSILIWAYPRETKTNNGNLKMPPFRRVRLLTRHGHSHSFCRYVGMASTRLRMCKAISPEQTVIHFFPIQKRFRWLFVMFKTRAAVFYRDLKPRGTAEWF